MISKRTIDQIFETAVIEEVIGDFLHLKRAGKNFRGLSPFTSEKTPSFYVVPHKGIYKDFSSGKGGNVVNFLMEHEKFSYPEALRWLANKYNIQIEEDEVSEEQQEAISERDALSVVVNFAQKWFEERLWESEDGRAIGHSYFKERGFRDDIIRHFGLGYCPEGWDTFTKEALAMGYNKEMLEKAGLTKDRDGSLYDFFRGRVIFPIHNLSGKCIGFGARTLRQDKKVAKYFNSPDSELYHKSKVLYGIDKAKAEILREDLCYLVEGYTDVISLHQSGLTNVVASSGTALTEDQIKLIRRFTRNITILFDGDAAGIRASFRGIDLILTAGMNVKVVLFPDGDDPDSFAKKVSSEELRSYVTASAKDFIVFKADLLAADAAGDPIRRAEMIRDIVDSIAVIPDAIQRSVYTQECSRLLEVPEQTLVFEINKRVREKLKRAGKDMPPPPEPEEGDPGLPEGLVETRINKLELQEREFIRMLLSYGPCELNIEIHTEDGSTAPAQTTVAEYLLDELHFDEIHLVHPACRNILELYRSEVENGRFPDDKVFVMHEDPEVSKLSADLLTTRYHISDNWELMHDIISETEETLLRRAVKEVVYRLKLRRVQHLIEEVNEGIQHAQGNGHSNDELFLLLSRKQKLDKAKMTLSSHFGTTIL